MMPAMARKRHVVIEERMKKLAAFAESTDLNRIEWGNNTDIGVITSGICYQYSREAFGDDVSYLKLGMVYPLPEKLISEFASKVKTLYVIEELDPFIEEFLKQKGIPCIGKEKLPLTGEYSANLIRRQLLGISEDTGTIQENIPVRPPVLCPGCPHRAVFYVLGKNKLTVTGDIGCYTLGSMSPLEAMDTCVCMGASIGMAHGMEKALGNEDNEKRVAVIGDSTFIHSGITGLIDIVYNKGTSTVIILDNSITGMTGHQPNPATGYTIKGEKTRQVDLVKLCNAIGIDRVRVIDPFRLDEFEKAVREEIAADEPSVIIAQRPCALLKSVKYEGKVRVSKDRCKYCKVCMRLGCPAIVDTGEGIHINEDLCVGCELCLELCRFNAIEKAGVSNG